MKTIVLWAPYLRTDNRQTAQQAVSYLPDNRAEHFWDLWRYGTRIYAEQFSYPQAEAWDLFVGYEAEKQWGGAAPKVGFYFQHRDLDHGEPYSQEALEKALLRWIQ